VRNSVRFLSRLPQARLTCLLLAAIQLMPLPDEPETPFSKQLAIVSVGPDPVVPLTTPWKEGFLCSMIRSSFTK
jgi:hypothetical protein